MEIMYWYINRIQDIDKLKIKCWVDLTEKRKELEHTLESMKSWETTQRLQKVLDEKKKKQARAAEKLRQEVGGSVVCFSTKLKTGIVQVLTA